MESKKLQPTHDRHIIAYALITGFVLQLLLWYLEEGRYDLGFLYSLEIMNFLLFTLVSSAFIIIAYFILKGLKTGIKNHLLLSLLVGSLPTLGVLALVLFA